MPKIMGRWWDSGTRTKARIRKNIKDLYRAGRGPGQKGGEEMTFLSRNVSLGAKTFEGKKRNHPGEKKKDPYARRFRLNKKHSPLSLQTKNEQQAAGKKGSCFSTRDRKKGKSHWSEKNPGAVPDLRTSRGTQTRRRTIIAPREEGGRLNQGGRRAVLHPGFLFQIKGLSRKNEGRRRKKKKKRRSSKLFGRPTGERKKSEGILLGLGRTGGETLAKKRKVQEDRRWFSGKGPRFAGGKEARKRKGRFFSGGDSPPLSSRLGERRERVSCETAPDETLRA